MHTKGAAGKQVATYLQASSAGAIDIRHNYLGTWPKVLSNVTYTTAPTIKLGGFVSAPFDSSFDATNHWGEVDITGAETWSEDLFVTGRVTVKAGGTLTIAAGVKVIFVPTDTDADNIGDFRIDRAGGSIQVNGTVAAPVAFSALVGAPADLPTKGGYLGLTASTTGTTSVNYATFLDANIAISSGTQGTTTLTDVTVDAARADGVQVGETFTATRLTTKNGLGNGVTLSGVAIKSLDGLLSDKNASFGLAMNSATGATNLVTNSTFTNNAAGGVSLAASKVDLKQSNVKFNGFGLFVTGATSGSITASNIQSNNREGIFVGPAGGSNPTMTFTGNNVYSNTVLQSVARVTTTGITASSTYSGTTSVDSTAYTVPSGGSILYFEANYSEGGSTVTGYVLGASDAILKTFSDSSSSAWYEIALPGTTALRARVADSYQYDSGTTTVTQAIQSVTAVPGAEMAALRTTGGKVTATGNYWGLPGPSAAQVVELLANTIDFTGFRTSAVAGTGPQ